MARRRVLSVSSLALVLTGLTGMPAAAVDQRAPAVADRAVAFFAGEQRADGGFGAAEAGFPGFETPDAVLAIAQAAQSGPSYSPSQARAAVEAVSRAGRTGLDYLDDFSEGTTFSAQQAALTIVVADSVGIDPTAFDPQGDGAVNLVARLESGRGADGSYGFFNGTLQALFAFRLLGRPTDPQTTQYVLDAQQANGGWNFAGDPTANGEDVDTTARAVEALLVGGANPASPSITRALGLLARLHNDEGAWSSFGASDPNSTARVILAITAAGYDVADRCWRDVYDPSRTNRPYLSPDAFLIDRQQPDGRIASPSDSFGINTFATSQSVQALLRPRQVSIQALRPCPVGGYRLLTTDGGVAAFGSSSFVGSADTLPLNQPIVTGAASPSGDGYWLFAGDGGAFTFGDAGFFGSAADLRLNRPIVAAASTPSGRGYWLVAADGGVFTYGDAGFFGSAAELPLNRPIVAAASTPSGRGYWLVASDGGVFTYGDAAFFGSTGDLVLAEPVIDALPTPSGRGYWLFAADGGVFTFGDAAFFGSAVATGATTPFAGATASRGGAGYILASLGGEVRAFGDARVHGSLEGSGRLVADVIR